MAAKAFVEGVRRTIRRPGLVFLVYLFTLIVGVVIAVPFFVVLSDETALSGFGGYLAGELDVSLMAELTDATGHLLSVLSAQLLWLIPVLLLWNALLSVGLIHALRQGGFRGFWDGVGRFGARSALQGLCTAVLAAVLVVGIVVVLVGAGFVWDGPVARFRLIAVIGPLLIAGTLCVLDLALDYARIILVIEEPAAMSAWLRGFSWPGRYRKAIGLYLLWLLPAFVLWAAPFAIDAMGNEQRMMSIVGIFLLQQVGLLVRSGVTVAWYGSEVSLYERVRWQEGPLIATEASSWGAVEIKLESESPDVEA